MWGYDIIPLGEHHSFDDAEEAAERFVKVRDQIDVVWVADQTTAERWRMGLQ